MPDGIKSNDHQRLEHYGYCDDRARIRNTRGHQDGRRIFPASAGGRRRRAQVLDREGQDRRACAHHRQTAEEERPVLWATRAGIILVQNGYHERQLLAAHRGIFQRDGVGSIIPPKSWVIKTSSEKAARDLVKELRAKTKDRQGFCEKVYILQPTSADYRALDAATLLPRKSIQEDKCVGYLSSDGSSDVSDDDDADDDYTNPQSNNCDRGNGKKRISLHPDTRKVKQEGDLVCGLVSAAQATTSPRRTSLSRSSSARGANQGVRTPGT
ncbi:unnamed protein product [Ectocarpus sp. 6 AP-2014]